MERAGLAAAAAACEGLVAPLFRRMVEVPSVQEYIWYRPYRSICFRRMNGGIYDRNYSMFGPNALSPPECG